MSTALDVRGLSVTYPRSPVPVLRDVDLHLDHGAQLLVMGASGSGKSTLLRVLAGIVPQTIDADVTGEAAVAGLDPRTTPVPVLAERVATLTQNPADQLCLPTVIDEVAFACENRAVPPAQIQARVEWALEQVGGAHLLHRRTSELSGGEGQRVALAAVLAADPQLLLLDEPTALLDPAGVDQIGRAIAAAGPTGRQRSCVLIEHRLDELPQLPEQVLVLGADGTVTAAGPTGQVLGEDGARLAATGSWLPLWAELTAALGAPLASGAPSERAGLRALARRHGLPAQARAPRTRSVGARPAPVILRAEGLTVYRGDRQVLGGVDLTIRAGTVTAVVGANGSGKSSLLLGLAGLARVGGRLEAGRVGMVFQQPEHQFLTRSVREEIAYGLGRDRRDDAAAEVMHAFQLDGLAERDPFRLSGGQQRRLSLAAMTVLDNDILLTDEPTFGQDRRTTRAVAAALRRLAGQGRGVVLVTHDLRLVAGLADHVVVLGSGTVLADGAPEQVLGDVPVLKRAVLALPPSLRAWRDSGLPLAPLLAALDDALELPTELDAA